MEVIILRDTSIKGKPIGANPAKIVDLPRDDARALLAAGKAVLVKDAPVAPKLTKKQGEKAEAGDQAE